MSYSFNFIATSKEKALAKLAETARLQPNFGGKPHALAAEAVANVPDLEGLGFYVSATGHQCLNAHDFTESRCNIEVRPVTVD